MVSQKCQYALRAIFELAKRKGQGAVRIADIAEAQAIPKRFLEVILGQLKQGGFVASQRGSEGGYVLVRSASELSVGEVIRFVQGPVGPVDCLIQDPAQKCPLYGDCVFLAMWQEVADAIAEVYERTTFQELVDKEARMHRGYVASYSI
jgi:Rrf2 family cysteine metabolism transcriptional repressor